LKIEVAFFTLPIKKGKRREKNPRHRPFSSAGARGRRGGNGKKKNGGATGKDVLYFPFLRDAGGGG